MWCVRVCRRRLCLTSYQPRLLLIAPPSSYRTAAYIAAARRNHIDILVASEGRYSLVSEIAAGLHIDLNAPDSLDVLLAANQEHPFAGVIATDDVTVELGSRIASALGLPHNPPFAARISRRKDLSRKALTDAAASVPRFRVLDLDQPLGTQIDGFALPGIIKPLSLSASRGVIRADTQTEVIDACERVRKILATETLADDFSARNILLEEFIPGPEVALEGLLHSGELNVLAIFDKPDPLDGPYFEETYYVTPSRHNEHVQEQLINCTVDACAALGLREGPVHAELRIGASGPVVVEVASRTIGGECARLLEFGTGHSLEDLVIMHAIEKPLPFEQGSGGAGVLMLPIPAAGLLRRIEGISEARAVPGITDVLVSIRDGYELVPLPEGGSYMGFIFARGETADEVEATLRAAYAKLNVVIAPLMRLQDLR